MLLPWWSFPLVFGLAGLVSTYMAESNDPRWQRRGFSSLLLLILLTLLAKG